MRRVNATSMLSRCGGFFNLISIRYLVSLVHLVSVVQVVRHCLHQKGCCYCVFADADVMAAGDGTFDCRLSVQCVGDHAASIDSPLALSSTDFTGEPTDGKLLEAHAQGISTKAIFSDPNSGVCSTSSQRRRSRSPVPARQESAFCKLPTIAPSHADTGEAAYGHCARNVLATIFERSAILSNKRRIETPVCQGASRRGDGPPSAHKRSAPTTEMHAFESFSAQALACEGPTHNPCSDHPIEAVIPSRMPSPYGMDTLAPADQVHSTAACKTPGWVPGAPMWEQPGVVRSYGEMHPI